MLFKKHWPVFGWSIIIIILSGIPGNYIPEVLSFRDWLSPDKLAHVLMFGGFAFLFLNSFRATYRKNKFPVGYILLTLLIGTIFGFLMEVLQRHLFIGRNGNVYDLGADFVGLLVGIISFHIFSKIKIDPEAK